MQRCRSCDAEVVFVPSAKSGKPMILDAEPRKGVVCTIPQVEGIDHLFASREAVAIGGESLLPPSAHVVDVYTDHHATCPDAARWKR